ncbi:MAG: hypothetical protein SFZ24_07055 [Planctomycetota bacterium]|nr:hypothetical protein [Planctomycetota bacterium]
MPDDPATSPPRRYRLRRKLLVLMGASFEITDGRGELTGWCRQKAFKLREDFRFYADRGQERELFRIRARSVLDFGATYDVMLPDGAVLGGLRRGALTSLVRDSWTVLGPDGSVIAGLREDSGAAAFLRRVLPLASLLMNQGYELREAGSDRCIARLTSRRSLLAYVLDIEILEEHALIDDLIVLACACLLASIEGKQE